jgi:hypothetical protein
MSKTKPFPLRVILTATTGRCLTESKGDRDNGIGGLYSLLGWMVGESPFTHQLRRFSEECVPWLFRWFPELEAVNSCLEALDKCLGSYVAAEQAIQVWLAGLKETNPDLKDSYEVPMIPPRDDHAFKDAVDELREMAPNAKIVVVDRCD